MVILESSQVAANFAGVASAGAAIAALVVATLTYLATFRTQKKVH